MKALRLALAPVVMSLLAALFVGGSPPVVYRFAVTLQVDSSVTWRSPQAVSRGVWKVQLFGFNTSTHDTAAKCPACQPVYNCPCSAVLAFHGIKGSVCGLCLVHQDSLFDASNGKKGRQTVIAYYVPRDPVSGKMRHARLRSAAHRFVLGSRDTTIVVAFPIPLITVK